MRLSNLNNGMNVLFISLLITLVLTSFAFSQNFEIKESLYEASKIKTTQLSPLTVKKLNEAQLMVNDGYNQAALNSLNRTLYQVKSPYEKAVIIQTAAHIILLKDDQQAYLQAIELFETVVQLNALTDAEQRNILLNIALLNGQLENYKQAVIWFQKWMSEQQYANKEIDSKKIMQLAQFYQLDEQLNIAETYYQKAIKQAIKNKEPVIESWYVQWLSVNYNLENFKKCEAILTLLISMSADKLQYYRQLAGIYEWQDNSKQALSAWEMAYKQSLLTEKEDVILLAQLLLRLNYPLKAAKVLDQFYKQSDSKTLLEQDYELLARAWNEALEFEQAIASYKKAFNVLKNPKYAQVIAQLYIEKLDFQNALENLNKVTENQSGEYYLLLGYVYVQLDNTLKAMTAYEQATKFEKSKNQAIEWLEYLSIIATNK
ncbi:tetratricopeptide repeat protein [Marinicellulosiphila megalodicopiae]|uniref:tetratricopeptide repeat protein n=1 Tax=Marinicellulosiphila megalodicopiae TaxID=2724896 RepID=UPI003BAE4F24